MTQRILVKTTLEKTPVWGKPVREREFFLFLQILEITSAKIKPTAFTYLFPSISVLEINWKKPNTAFLDFCAKTAVPYGLYENVPRN
jgi:hypothetical protein